MNKTSKILLISFLIATVLVAVSCRKQQRPGFTYNPGNIIIPEDTSIDNTLAGSDYDSLTEGAPMPEPLVSVLPELETLVSVVNVNLDSDALEEQIIAVNEKNNPGSTINLKVVKYNQIMKKNNVVWSGPTKSSNITKFDISVKDVTGDGQQEIICEGRDKDGRLAVDILKKAPGYAYYEYSPVFSIVTEGSVEIMEHQRSEAYSAGVFTKAESFPIDETSPVERPGESEVDLRRRTFAWKGDQNKYRVVNTSIIPGKEIKDAELAKLLRRGEDAIIIFLSGTWRKENSQVMMFIDKNDKSISIYNGSNIQTYIWQDIYHSSVYQINKIIFRHCVNEILRNLSLKMEMNINSLSELDMYIEDKVSYTSSKYIEEFSGKFKKIDPVKDSAFINSFLRPDVPEMPELSGFYRSDSGLEITFDMPFFTLSDTANDEKKNGGFAVYNVGYNVLDLRYFSIGRQQIAKQTYRFTYSEAVRRGEVIRTLLLQPGTVGVYGFQRDDTNTMRFEQIELVEVKEDGD